MNYLKLIVIILFHLFICKNSFSQPQTEWVQRFNSPGNYDDYVTDMAIDKSGNVYLTGYVFINDSNQNIVTIKYNTFGVQQWARYYDSPDHREDKSTCIAVDDSGNVIVAGTSYMYSSSYDYLTIKYNSFGDSLWVRRNTEGLSLSSMALDKNGNIYETGIKFGLNSEDIMTVKYDIRGDLIWLRYFNGTADGFDIPLKIYVDNNSNSYISGQTSENFSLVPKGIVIKYRENGDEVWAMHPPSAFVIFTSKVDDSQNVFSVGHSEPNNNTDISILKLDSIGSLIWQRKYNRSDTVPDQDDFYSDYTLDNNRNSIFTCLNSDNVLRWDIATVKYNQNGDFLWAKIFGSFSSNDESKSIITDKLGNVYVCGFKDDGLFPKYLTIKYNPLGDLLWFSTYNNNFPFGSHKANKILSDTIGNIYVTGVSQGSITGDDIATIKYSQLTKIENESENISNHFNLLQNYPNPFNSTTLFPINISDKSFVTLKVFNYLGQEISLLINEYKNKGNYNILFDASNFPSGLYFCSLFINGVFNDTKKLLLIK
ncbi:MAG TPA: SBBP repeat-containing protein [Ignavibacteria bacterium]|nr:SBBP repeat-containing protein [Ignavibacteria bacterium]